MTTTKEKLLTADDLLELHSKGVRGELIRGVFCKTMSVGVDHAKTVVNLTILLGTFVKSRRLGSVMASDMGVWLERSPDTVREPDIAYISAEKMPLGVSVPGYAEEVPDIVVEIASPDDSLQSLKDKAMIWQNFGVPLVWVGYPSRREVEVYSTGGAVVTLGTDDVLDGGDVLPGFSCRVSEIFDI